MFRVFTSSGYTKDSSLTYRTSMTDNLDDYFKGKRIDKINPSFTHHDIFNSDKLELLIIKAIIAANNKIKPLAASSLKNHLKGLDI